MLVAIKGIGWFLIAGALVELKLSYRLPTVHEPDRNLRFDWVKYRTGRYLAENLNAVRSREVILLSIIGLAIMWSIGQVLLAAYPSFAKDNLGVTDVRIIQGTLGLRRYRDHAGVAHRRHNLEKLYRDRADPDRRGGGGCVPLHSAVA